MFNPYDYYIMPEEYEEAARNDIKRNNVNDHIRCLGWSKYVAITKPLRIYTNRSAAREIASSGGIPPELLRARIYLGWNKTKAATHPVRNQEA